MRRRLLLGADLNNFQHPQVNAGNLERTIVMGEREKATDGTTSLKAVTNSAHQKVVTYILPYVGVPVHLR